MKLKEFTHNEDYVRFNRELIIEVNSIITANVEVCGGVTSIKSEKYGDVIIFEDAEPYATYSVNGKKLKGNGFREFYNKLFYGSFEEFDKEVCDFAVLQTAKNYDNHLLSLSRKQKINLLKEVIDEAPTFISDQGETILHRHWACNAVLEALGVKFLPCKKYTIKDSDGKTICGVLKENYLNLYKSLKNGE